MASTLEEQIEERLLTLLSLIADAQRPYFVCGEKLYGFRYYNQPTETSPALLTRYRQAQADLLEMTNQREDIAQAHGVPASDARKQASQSSKNHSHDRKGTD